MRYLIATSILLLLSGCQNSPNASNTSEEVAYKTANAAAAGEMIFCREINRRTTREDCDDLTAVATAATRGSAAFNVPSMTRGRATLIQLAISLDPPPIEQVTPADSSGVENMTMPAENASGATTPGPSPRPRATAPAPAEVVKALPGPTESYSPLVGRDMRAELIGQGFEIKPKSPASQVLSPGSTTTWEWEVTPLRGSDYALTVKTAVEGVMANGQRVVLRSTVETRKVDVKVNWVDRLRDGLTEAPTWIKLVTGVLVALGALFAAWWALVRSAKGEKPADKKSGDDDKKD